MKTHQSHWLTRRQFLNRTISASVAATTLNACLPITAESQPATESKRKIKLGLIGCGGRGSWIGGLFKKHGEFEIHAVADYFPDVAKAAGDALGVEASRRFSTLSGYKRV